MGARPRLSQGRRMEILESAVQVIAERGMAETRIADIAGKAGVSAALVLYYFDSKDRLLTEALSHAEDRFYLRTFHELTRLDRARDRLVALIDLALPPGGEVVSDWTLWLELWSRAARDPEVAKKREALDRRWRTTIAEIVRDGQRSGEFADVDADAFALFLASLIDGLAVQALLRDPEASPERVREVCVEAAARELGYAPSASDARPAAASGTGRR